MRYRRLSPPRDVAAFRFLEERRGDDGGGVGNKITDSSSPSEAAASRESDVAGWAAVLESKVDSRSAVMPTHPRFPAKRDCWASALVPGLTSACTIVLDDVGVFGAELCFLLGAAIVFLPFCGRPY